MNEQPEFKSTLSRSLQGNATKPSRLPQQTIAFVQAALATVAAENLDPRDRQFLTHVVAHPQLTLQELASYAGIRKPGQHMVALGRFW